MQPTVSRHPVALACSTLAVFSVLLLQGCPGSLEIWMMGSPVTDDDDVLSLDYSSFEGYEVVNVDWDQEAWPQGVDDCQARWYAAGTDATIDNQALCPACGQIWSVQLTAMDGDADCLQGTALEEQDEMTVRLGFEFLAELPHFFTVWRSFSDEAMEEVGVGAINEASAEFTWSGQEGHRNDGEVIGYEWFLSGEGSF